MYIFFCYHRLMSLVGVIRICVSDIIIGDMHETCLRLTASVISDSHTFDSILIEKKTIY